jgi:hypothetical protein
MSKSLMGQAGDGSRRHRTEARVLFRFIQVTGRKTVFAVGDLQDSLESGRIRTIQMRGISLPTRARLTPVAKDNDHRSSGRCPFNGQEECDDHLERFGDELAGMAQSRCCGAG